jgi:hypothetical protein
MKYEIGDKVLVKLTNEDGVITEILNEKMVIVAVRGVHFPAYVDQIDFPYFRNFTKHLQQKKQEPTPVPKTYIDQVPVEKKKAIQKTTEEQGVFLLLYPKFITDFYGDEVVELFKIYLVNQTSTPYQFTFQQKFFGRTDFELTNVLDPFHDFYVYDVKFEDFSDAPSIEILFSLVTLEKTKAATHSTITKWKGKQLFKAIENMQINNDPCIKTLLFATYPNKIIENTPTTLSNHVMQKNLAYKANVKKQYAEPALSVVDLHIDKIIDNTTGLTNGDIVQIQMAHFEKYVDLAITHQLKSLIVIHGIGTGKLKEEVHQSLKMNKHVNFFINQYDPRFGWGATEIFFNT